MPTRQEVPVNHYILQWAREQADFTVGQAAARAGIKDLKRKGITAEDRLAMWEHGKEKPTLNELELIAKAYRRPLLTFFLSKPPLVETSLEDFRTISNRSVETSSPEFAAFRRQIEALQKEVRILIEEESGKSLEFIGSANMDMSPTEVTQAIRSKLGFSFNNQERIQDSVGLFNIIREHASNTGIFVLRKADLGSGHSKISVQEFRGLVISDPYAPFIVVNPNDARAALLFTLIHELAHLWLGESGISNFDAFSSSQSNYQEREIFCNNVAAEFLAPAVIFLREWQTVMDIEFDLAIQFLSDKFKVSRVVIARRLLDLDQITDDVYWQLYNQWRDEWDKIQEHNKLSDSGPGYFITTKSKLGSKLLNTVIGAAYRGNLSFRDASKLLGIKIDYFDRFYQG